EAASFVSKESTTAYIFFFQAEGGIRDKLVTGVQTCALPISLPQSPKSNRFKFKRAVSLMTNVECRNPKECRMTKTESGPHMAIRASTFGFFGLRHSLFVITRLCAPALAKTRHL